MTILTKLTRASLVGIIAASCIGCSEIEASKARAIQRQQEYEQLQEKKSADLESIRTQRRTNNYSEVRAFTNKDGSIDKYFPIEDLLMHSESWQIFYTDINTKEVKTEGFWKRDSKLIRDVKINQTPYAEWLNSNTTLFGGGDPQKVILHLRDNTRIQGGIEAYRNGNVTYHRNIQTMNVNSGDEESK